MNIYRRTMAFIILAILIVPGTLLASPTGGKATAATPPAAELKEAPAAFLDAPVEYMTSVYRDYHEWRVTEGIEKAERAIASVDKVYAANANAEIRDSKLKLNKAYQVKATLHTLLGMLYNRKALLVLNEQGSGGSQRAAVLKKLEEGGSLTEEDLKAVADEAEGRSSASAQQEDFVRRSINEFASAIKTDPDNPVPHFQLATVYASSSLEATTDAEREYFEAARLSFGEGDKKSTRRAFEALVELNPQSGYVAQVRSMLEAK